MIFDSPEGPSIIEVTGEGSGGNKRWDKPRPCRMMNNELRSAGVSKLYALPPALSSAIGLFLGVFAILTFIFFIASLSMDWVLIVIFALIFLALVVLTIGTATRGGFLEHPCRYFTGQNGSCDEKMLKQ